MDREECKKRILSPRYWDFIIPGYRQGDVAGLGGEDRCVQEMDYNYRAVYVDSTGREPLSIERYWYNSIPNCYAPLDMAALSQTGIATVQNYPGLQLQGEGVLLGFLDTGIDYTNAVFRALDGRTRIAGIWDQTIQTGIPPSGFLYGSEYAKEQIDEALRADNPLEVVPSMDIDGHGTYLASVAAGSANVQNRFLGAAPESEIAVVKLKEAKPYLKEFYAIRPEALCYQENDMMLGLRYLNLLAERRGMPLVICLAMGTNFGGHNNTSLLSNILNLYSGSLNRIVVIGGGNEANQRHHYSGVLSSGAEKREVELRVGEGTDGFVAELWTELPNVLTLSIISPSGEQTQVISVRQATSYTYTFLFDRTTVRVEYRLLMENNNSQLIFLKFETPAKGIWKLAVEPVQLSDGEFHIWLPMQEFLGGETYFLEANPETTITEPSTTENSMTVAYYNGADNSIDINSGRGYTRSRFIKPDFAAPGVQVTGAGTGGRFVTRTGSSAAAAITAGAAALLVEWIVGQPGDQVVSSGQIRNLLVLGAEQKPFLRYPNQEWGYGTLDLYQTLDKLRRL